MIPKQLIETFLSLTRPLMASSLIPESVKRFALNNFLSLSFPLPDDVTATEVLLNGVRSLKIQRGGFTSRILLYLHGGGYHWGSPQTHRRLVAQLVKKAGITAFLPDYRLAPEYRFPAAVDDAFAAYKGLLQSGYQPENIIIGGDSAGGGLTLCLLLKIRAEKKPQPAAAFCYSPWTDLTQAGASYSQRNDEDIMLMREGTSIWADSYAGSEKTNPLASPLYAEDFHNLATVAIHTGEKEILLDDSVSFQRKASAGGAKVILKIWPGMMHVFPFFHDFLPEGRMALQETVDFIHAHLA